APKIDVTFTGQESNLERLLAKTLQAPANAQPANGTPADAWPAVHLDIVDAKLTIHDADTKRCWVISSLSVSAKIDNDAGRTMEMHVQGTLLDGAETGSLRLDASLRNLPGPDGLAIIKGRFSALPLGMANVALRRVR